MFSGFWRIFQGQMMTIFSNWRRRAAGLFLLAAFGMAPGGASAARGVPHDPDGFTAYVAERFQEAMPDATISIVAPLSLSIKGPAPSDANLSHPYADCQRDTRHCRAIIDRFVAQMSAAFNLSDAPIERSALRIVVRPLAYLEKQRAALPSGSEPVAAPLPGGFCEMWAADRPTAIVLLNSRDLAPLGLSAEDALDIGRKNLEKALRRDLSAALREWRAGRPDAIGLLTGNPYESTLFAMPELWIPLFAAMDDDLLVAVPAPDVVLFASGADPHAVEKMMVRAREVMAVVTRPFTDTVFRWNPAGWRIASPGANRAALTGPVENAGLRDFQPPRVPIAGSTAKASPTAPPAP
jgi:hypothetical protein